MTGRTNSGGGGLNLRIVDGNTQPTNPVENLIWINTETRIPNWYWQASEPSQKETGTLWIVASSVATNVLSLLRHNVLEVGIGTIRQWNGTEWANVGGKVYYNGAWHNFQTFVYDGSIGDAEQNFNHNVGGYPWSKSTRSCVITTTENEDSFICAIGYGTGGNGLLYAPNAIDFTNVSKVKITYIASSSGAGTKTCRASVFTSASSGSESGLVASTTIRSSAEKTSIEIDTASLSGEYLLGLFGSSNASGGSWSITYTIYSIELIS